jgi:hypothetical protein
MANPVFSAAQPPNQSERRKLVGDTPVMFWKARVK